LFDAINLSSQRFVHINSADKNSAVTFGRSKPEEGQVKNIAAETIFVYKKYKNKEACMEEVMVI
jgi:hypothetical protein